MPVYKLHGFRWPRGGNPSIRVYIVLNNLDDAAAEYIQQKRTSRLILDSFKRNDPEIMAHLPELQLIEQYDPDDTSDAAVSQPYAYVADKVIILPDSERPADGLGKSIDEGPLNDAALSPQAWDALAELRDKIAPGQKIGWWIVYNGDPERHYPGMEEDDIEENGHSGSDKTGQAEQPDTAEPPKTPNLKKKRSFWRRGG
ncbi:hypothetical protein VTN77DRAFT_3262 [Rasamsonia byssochlamydoides]|uniref:uncharacterized protein n=1 Tax=Rasamsonia byssochlamydoides TaxID=89139 RepID=UPI0037449EF2